MLGQSENHRIEPTYQATLLSLEDRSQQAYADPSTAKVFYNSTGMTLNLTIKMCRGFLWDSTARSFRYKRLIKYQFQRLLGQKYDYFSYYFDHPDTQRTYSREVMTFGLLIEHRTRHEPKFSEGSGEPFLVGLLMQPESSRKTYKRVGLWTLNLRQYSLE